jgi:hypothetical protein
MKALIYFLVAFGVFFGSTERGSKPNDALSHAIVWPFFISAMATRFLIIENNKIPLNNK